MNKLKRTLILAGCVAALGLGTAAVMAQPPGGGGAGGAGGGRRGGRGGNPQAQLDAYRTALAVTDDAEWTAISAKITAVTDAQQAMRGGGAGRRGGRGGAGGAGGAGGFTPPTPSDAEAALQKAIDDKAPAADIKTKIAAVRTERKAKADAAQAAYVKAQEDLRSVLSARQEAILTLRIQTQGGAGGGGGGFGGGLPPLLQD